MEKGGYPCAGSCDEHRAGRAAQLRVPATLGTFNDQINPKMIVKQSLRQRQCVQRREESATQFRAPANPGLIPAHCRVSVGSLSLASSRLLPGQAECNHVRTAEVADTRNRVTCCAAPHVQPPSWEQQSYRMRVLVARAAWKRLKETCRTARTVRMTMHRLRSGQARPPWTQPCTRRCAFSTPIVNHGPCLTDLQMQTVD